MKRMAWSFPLHVLILLMALALTAGLSQGQNRPGSAASGAFLETMNPLSDVVLPRLYPVIASDVSPTLGDATLINRIRFVVALAMAEAAAPYHPTAVGMYSRLPRRPVEARTDRNINTAMLHAAYQALSGLLPDRQPVWREMLSDFGLNPDDASTDLDTAVGIGNVAGKATHDGRLHDGMNQEGDYQDTTGYVPVNSAFELRDPSRWQPGLRLMGTGVYTVQQFVTPQLANTETFAPFDPREMRVPPPAASDPENWEAYTEQVDAVLETLANLTDLQKMKAELFDNKVASLGLSYLAVAEDMDLSPADTVRGYLVKSAAWMDSAVVTWQEKSRYDAVRPFSAIPYVYGEDLVTSWGGPGAGRSELPASQWRSYLPENDHSEYPSGSTCGCYAHAQALRRFTGTDELDWTVAYPPGSSRIEPGFTPAQELNLNFATWTDFASDCGNSRHWGGVHFPAAVEASAAYCSVFGDLAYEYYLTLMDGTAPLREPAQALDVDPWLAASRQTSAPPITIPDADRPTPLTCENVAESVIVTAFNSGVICNDVDTSGLQLLTGFLDAVSISGELELGVQVCFRESGSLIFLDTMVDPPRLTELTSYHVSDMSCGWIDQAGTVVLVASPLSISATDSRDFLRLTDCELTTTHNLNFRATPNGNKLSDVIARNTTLVSFARTDGWFNVVYRGIPGWISADYVRATGTC